MEYKHVKLRRDDQWPTVEKAKLALMQERGDSNLADNEAVALLAEHYLGHTERQS